MLPKRVADHAKDFGRRPGWSPQAETHGQRLGPPQLICPSCQCAAVDPTRKSVAESSPSRSRKEGRFAVVTNVGSGMRWTRAVRETNAPNADGEVVWS